jgi:hypothetical protein
MCRAVWQIVINNFELFYLLIVASRGKLKAVGHFPDCNLFDSLCVAFYDDRHYDFLLAFVVFILSQLKAFVNTHFKNFPIDKTKNVCYTIVIPREKGGNTNDLDEDF